MSKLLSSSLAAGTLAGALALAAPGVQAASVNFDGFSYTGSVTAFDTLSDAQGAVNARSGPHTIPTLSNANGSTVVNGRDGSLYADTNTNSFIFLTSWYFTPQSEVSRGTSGFGNPNNTNTGFVQLYDLDGSSVNTLDIGWSGGNTQFNVDAAGSNAGSSETARLWPAPETGGPASLTAGVFQEYDLSFSANFGSAATGPLDSMPDSVSGAFTGIFENTNTTDPALQGFYVYDFLFQGGTWAETEDAVALFREGSDFDSTVATSFVAPVPLPAGLPLLGAIVAGLGLLGWRRRAAAA